MSTVGSSAKDANRKAPIDATRPADRLERDLDQLISEHGVNDVLAALCRWCHKYGMERLFTKLNRVYEWLDKVKDME